jgi:hypothetical protein
MSTTTSNYTSHLILGAATFRQAAFFSSNTSVSSSNLLFEVVAGVERGSQDPPITALRYPVRAPGFAVGSSAYLAPGASGLDVLAAPGLSPLVHASIVMGPSLTLCNLAGAAVLQSSSNSLTVPGQATFGSDVTVQGSLQVNRVQYNYSNVTVFSSQEVRSNTLTRGVATFSNDVVVAWPGSLRMVDGGGSSALIATSNSRVGVGTGGPLATLHVAGDAIVHESLALSNASGSVVLTSSADGQLGIESRDSGLARLVLCPAEGFAAGLIAKEGGGGALTVRNGGGMLRLGAEGADGTNALGVYLTPSNNYVGVGTSNPVVALHVIGQIVASQDVFAYSDCNYKLDLDPIDGALQKLGGLTGYTFRFTDDASGRRHAGLLAQDVERVLPEVVERCTDDGRLCVAYGNMTALLVNALKEASQRIVALEAKVRQIAGPG